MRLLTKVFALALVVGMTACAPKIAGLQVSEVFTHPNITRHGIIVGGVVSVDEELSQQVMAKYGNIVRTGVIEEREDINVASVGSFINTVGKAESQKIWTKYRNTGEIPTTVLASLAEQLPDKRFVIFAKIDTDNVAETNRRTEGHKKKNSDGTTTWVRGKTVAMTSREVGVTMNVYDLKQKNSAFSGSLNHSSSNSKEYTDAPTKTASIGSDIASIIKAAKGVEDEAAPSQEYPAPTAPTTESVLKPIFHGFAKNFPEQED